MRSFLERFKKALFRQCFNYHYNEKNSRHHLHFKSFFIAIPKASYDTLFLNKNTKNL